MNQVLSSNEVKPQEERRTPGGGVAVGVVWILWLGVLVYIIWRLHLECISYTSSFAIPVKTKWKHEVQSKLWMKCLPTNLIFCDNKWMMITYSCLMIDFQSFYHDFYQNNEWRYDRWKGFILNCILWDENYFRCKHYLKFGSRGTLIIAYHFKQIVLGGGY